MNVRHSMGVLHSFSIKNILMNLSFFFVWRYDQLGHMKCAYSDEKLLLTFLNSFKIYIHTFHINVNPEVSLSV